MSESAKSHLDHVPSRRVFVKTSTAAAVGLLGAWGRSRGDRRAGTARRGPDEGSARPDDGRPDPREVEGGQPPLP